jgi:ABC-type antimicrobial peptide transport system permease subunit
MLLLEALALGVVGGALAALLAAPASRIVLDSVRVISRLDVRWRLEPLPALAPLLAAVAIALAAALPPALRGGRLDLGPLHRHE